MSSHLIRHEPRYERADGAEKAAVDELNTFVEDKVSETSRAHACARCFYLTKRSFVGHSVFFCTPRLCDRCCARPVVHKNSAQCMHTDTTVRTLVRSLTPGVMTACVRCCTCHPSGACPYMSVFVYELCVLFWQRHKEIVGRWYPAAPREDLNRFVVWLSLVAVASTRTSNATKLFAAIVGLIKFSFVRMT